MSCSTILLVYGKECLIFGILRHCPSCLVTQLVAVHFGVRRKLSKYALSGQGRLDTREFWLPSYLERVLLGDCLLIDLYFVGQNYSRTCWEV